MGKQSGKPPSPPDSETTGSGAEEGDASSVQIAQQLAVLAAEAARVAAGLQRSGEGRRRRRSRGRGRSGGGQAGSSSGAADVSGPSGGSPKVYAVVNPACAPQGVYLTQARLEASFLPGIGWGALGGSRGDVKGFPVGPGDVREALAYYSARHPRAGKITVFE